MDHGQPQSYAALDDAFRVRLYQQHALSLMTYARRHVSTREDAEDIVLEVFLAASEQPELSRLSEEKQLINVDAVWSPDGKYIASAEGTQSLAFDKQSYVVKVWVA